MAKLELKATNGTVMVTGPLDRDNVGAAWRSRNSWLGSEGDVKIDLAGIEQVDSAGLAFLIQVKAELGEQNRELSLQNIHTQLQQFAEVSGVTELLSLSYADSKSAT